MVIIHCPSHKSAHIRLLEEFKLKQEVEADFRPTFYNLHFRLVVDYANAGIKFTVDTTTIYARDNPSSNDPVEIWYCIRFVAGLSIRSHKVPFVAKGANIFV